ncbi:MAG: endonuclease/exonuclease/phosphatase family protein [Planctomycetaceae bacterium]
MLLNRQDRRIEEMESDSPELVRVSGSVFAGSGQRLHELTAVTALVLCVGSGLTVMARYWWFADLLANLRVQAVMGLGIVSVAAWMQRHWRLLALLCLAAAFHAVYFLPAFEPPSLSTEAPVITVAPTITVMTANVNTVNRRYVAIENELTHSGADVIAVIELSPELHEHLSFDFQALYPFSFVDPQGEGNFGIGLYSRLPLEQATIEYYNELSISSISAELQVHGQRLRIIATHPLPPMSSRAYESRNQHLRRLADAVRQSRNDQPDVPVIVMGDLNLTPWSPVFADFETSTDLKSAYRGQGLTPTWYRFSGFPFGLILDHVLATPDVQCSEYKVGSDIGSDHRCVTARFNLRQPVR